MRARAARCRGPPARRSRWRKRHPLRGSSASEIGAALVLVVVARFFLVLVLAVPLLALLVLVLVILFGLEHDVVGERAEYELGGRERGAGVLHQHHDLVEQARQVVGGE